ncbi:MAG TPA: 3-hydroxyacyl-CoA dehydrogenase NAD-binding domain-containing protein [Chitinophagaceae bacterium]|nr:3-hydroxyacyl-CoA dehydrogenase NAD-binding domain-containing protein [Chitinophagaceae bacterium]HPH33187.1 3-hydroxyacyl-CoA dehydrogenase NAD-binding domain-containing protein [Chitinophagaceae bacterium]
MEINSICVCGAGTMGSGIAQAAAQSGLATILYELNAAVLEKAKAGIDRNLQSLVEKGKMTAEEKQKVFGLIRFTDDLQTCLADVFIEAIVEKPELKIALFNQLAELNHGDVIFASNTSSLSITEIAKGVLHPERVIGMHFFNPATIMKLVEVVNTPFTNTATTETIISLAKQLKKTAVVCIDSPGFIVNRVARPYYIESLRLLEEGHAEKEQLDRLLEATGFKMGPFKLMDLIGHDINYAVSCSVWEQLGRPERLKPSLLQEEIVKQGKLGKKTGEGFYKYE